MKVIDLLNKIANGEEIPLKIRYDNKIWELDTNINEYYRHTGTISRWLFNEYTRTRNIGGFLNDEIEIIEDTPKEDKKIEKLYIGQIVDDNLKSLIMTTNLCNKEIEDKINEIIDKVNEL